MHKGGQINNVQLITEVRIAEMSQLQNCSVLCTKKGSYCEKEKNERKRGGVRVMCTKNGSYMKKLCEKEKKVGRGGGGHSRCKWRSEAFVKFKKKNSRGDQVGGGVGGVRVDVNREVTLF